MVCDYYYTVIVSLISINSNAGPDRGGYCSMSLNLFIPPSQSFAPPHPFDYPPYFRNHCILYRALFTHLQSNWNTNIHSFSYQEIGIGPGQRLVNVRLSRAIGDNLLRKAFRRIDSSAVVSAQINQTKNPQKIEFALLWFEGTSWGVIQESRIFLLWDPYFGFYGGLKFWPPGVPPKH